MKATIKRSGTAKSGTKPFSWAARSFPPAPRSDGREQIPGGCDSSVVMPHKRRR